MVIYDFHGAFITVSRMELQTHIHKLSPGWEILEIPISFLKKMQPGVQTGECGQNKWEDGVWTLRAAPWMGSPLYTCPPCHGAPTSVAGSTRQGPACWGPLDAPYRSDRHTHSLW